MNPKSKSVSTLEPIPQSDDRVPFTGYAQISVV